MRNLKFNLATLFVLLSTDVAIAGYCDIDKRTINIDFTTCSEGPLFPKLGCVRSRQRFVILGEKILRYEDEFNPRGVIFYLGKNIEVTNDPKMKDFLLVTKLPNTYIKAWVNASYSAGELRLQTVQTYHSRVNFTSSSDGSYFEANEKYMETTESYVIQINSCDTCTIEMLLTNTVISKTENMVYGFSDLSKKNKQICKIREGVN